jgi:N5-(carboxyethyl)ornithine synthase
MKTIGFPISHKENENRRAIIPADLKKLTNPDYVWIESGFGSVLGMTNDDFASVGCQIKSHEDVLKADIICDPKIGDADYLEKLRKGQTIFGWVHATQNRDITDKIIASGLTAYAWEHMFEGGRHTFWFNNELAGEAAVLHAFQCYGRLPFGLKVAVIGNGNTARGAVRVLNMLGAHIMQYGRKTEQLLRKEINKYDVIVNCILWDVNRKDHVISKQDLTRMKSDSMIIDVSCDRHGGIETCIPTTIEKPTYEIEGVLHYAVDHTPSLYFKTFSFQNSEIIIPFIEELMSENVGKVLQESLIFEEGRIIDQEIIKYQNR